MKSNKDNLWVEKYRPKHLSDYIFQDSAQESIFKKYLQTKQIPHLLFSGTQGSGKTTLAKILTNNLDILPEDILVINASNERGIDTFRDKILTFITTCPSSAYRIVLLEEADQLTKDAQFVLRNALEEYAEICRFIFTCNHVNKIIPPLRSRCQSFSFKAPIRDDLRIKMADMLINENVAFAAKDVFATIDVHYPDIRKIINVLQQYSSSGTFKISSNSDVSLDWKFTLLDLIEQDDWKGARKLICENATSDEWEEIYRFMYDNLIKSKKFSNPDNWDAGILVIADSLFRNSQVSDQEINMAACLIKLSMI